MEEKEEKQENLASEILNHLIVQNKRMFIAFMITLFMLFASNLAWLWVFQSYDYSSYQAESNDGGNANIIGNDGDINNGESGIKEEDKEKRNIKGSKNETPEKEIKDGN